MPQETQRVLAKTYFEGHAKVMQFRKKTIVNRSLLKENY